MEGFLTGLNSRGRFLWKSLFVTFIVSGIFMVISYGLCYLINKYFLILALICFVVCLSSSLTLLFCFNKCGYLCCRNCGCFVENYAEVV